MATVIGWLLIGFPTLATLLTIIGVAIVADNAARRNATMDIKLNLNYALAYILALVVGILMVTGVIAW
ncbi:MAG: hypothetical protein FWG25_10435 [Promicromonosporaceae bacterium]|nr:hypothetical protein [Promicromonosporaceae bacterium]